MPPVQHQSATGFCGVAPIAQRAHRDESHRSLGMQRAKALIAICSAKKAKIPPSEAFQITLDVLDGDV
jgi:hypothetical protein